MIRILTFILITFAFSIPSKDEFNNLFVNVATKGSPAVVSIISEKTEKVNDFFFFSPFDPFFDPFGESPHQQERKAQSLGSGVIIDANKGYIVTNNHVIEDAEEIKVILHDKRELDAQFVGSDPLSDLAIIKIETDNINQVQFGNSDNLQIGEWVIAIGSPFGLHLNHTVTAGIVSAVGRSDVISKVNFENFIQHDAAINPGNSGGALFDLEGNLVGINTAIATDGMSRSNAGVGFAIPINQAKRVIDDLIDGGKVLRGYLGVAIQDLDENKAKVLGIDSKNGAFVSMVVKGGPASNAGLLEKDVIVLMNSNPIESSTQLRNDVANMRPGDTVVFSVIRDQLTLTVPVILGTRPDQLSLQNSYRENLFDLIGLVTENNNDGPGVLILEVNPQSEAYSNNIRKGDIVIEIGRKGISNKQDYDNELLLYKKGDSIMLKVVRDGMSRYEAFLIK